MFEAIIHYDFMHAGHCSVISVIAQQTKPKEYLKEMLYANAITNLSLRCTKNTSSQNGV